MSEISREQQIRFTVFWHETGAQFQVSMLMFRGNTCVI